VYTGQPRSQIDQYITQAAANGTAVTTVASPDPATNGIIWTTSTPAQLGDLAQPMAAWVVNDAKQAGNNKPGVLYARPARLPDPDVLRHGVREELQGLLRRLPLPEDAIGLADIQKAVRQHRVGLALEHQSEVCRPVGRQRVHRLARGAEGGRPERRQDLRGRAEHRNLTNIANGAQAGTMAFAYYEIMFGAVDAIARKKAGAEVVPGFAPPNWILLKSNLPSSTEFFPLVPDIVNQFKTLWGK
jgi:hypothetical protein